MGNWQPRGCGRSSNESFCIRSTSQRLSRWLDGRLPAWVTSVLPEVSNRNLSSVISWGLADSLLASRIAGNAIVLISRMRHGILKGGLRRLDVIGNQCAICSNNHVVSADPFGVG